MMSRRRSPVLTLLSCAVLNATVSVGCTTSSDDISVVSVGNARLTETDLARMGGRLAFSDTSDATSAILVEDWVATALLSEEAVARGLDKELDVVNDIEISRRSVLASKLIERHFAELQFTPTDAELRTYLGENPELFKLREPLYRIRIIRSSDEAQVAEARTALRRALNSTSTDSLWQVTLERFADNAELDQSASSAYVPREDLSLLGSRIGEEIDQMAIGQLSTVREERGIYYFFQVVDRAEIGSSPQFEWIRQELTARMFVQVRKDAYRQLVEGLRARAIASGSLNYARMETSNRQ